MLQNLHVKNLALIDEAEVDFAGGVNILSGETGAGKSIIIGSINLALGGKVQKEMLRDPEKPALVELIFSVTEKQKQVLKQLDVETEDDEVILSRRITGGRGVSKVNGESVPASKVKEIASVLIDIHGQHEHQSLLSKKKHLEILDSYAKEEIEQPKKELAEAYKDYKKLVSELNDADVDEEERLREVSFLEYEVGEIEEAGLTVGEDEVLETQYKRFINGKKIVEALNQAYQYTGGMDQASELTGRALRELSGVSVYDEKIAELFANEEAAHEEKKPAEPRKAMGFIAVSIGAGMNEIFKELGADYIIEGGQTMNPSTEDMLNAIDRVNADTVFILPNNKNIVLAANQAKSLVEEKEIIVIPTKTVPQGITAIINFMPDADAKTNEEAMLEEIKNVKTGQMTYAVRDTHIDDKEIHEGDIMGIGDSGILADGKDLEETTKELIANLVDEDSELISIYYGEEVSEEDAEKFTEEITELYPDVDVDIQFGGQPIYYYVLAVE